VIEKSENRMRRKPTPGFGKSLSFHVVLTMDVMRIQISKWLPALLVMLVIFLFSARPPSELPYFGWADRIAKKGGHIIGYAILAFLYWKAFDFKEKKVWVAWLFAILYAITDEFHQSFVPGRFSSVWDVLIFDNLGALVSLWFANRYRKQNTTRFKSADR
jgi:VanZ family protein